MSTTEGWNKRREQTVVEYIVNRISADINGCWNWKGARDGRYGYFQYLNIVTGAHQALYQLVIGRIPEGKIICHKCDNTKCVNPKHLYAGTKKTNRQDFMKRHPKAMELCLEAARIGAKGVKRRWERMTKTEREKFVRKRAATQKKKRLLRKN